MPMSGGDDSRSNSSTEFSGLRWMTASASVLSGAAAQGVTALWHASKPVRLAAPAGIQTLFSGITRLAWVNSRGLEPGVDSSIRYMPPSKRDEYSRLRWLRVGAPALIEGLSHAALAYGVELLRNAGYIDEDAVVPLQCSSSAVAYMLGQMTHEQLERYLAVTGKNDGAAKKEPVVGRDIETGGLSVGEATSGAVHEEVTFHEEGTFAPPPGEVVSYGSTSPRDPAAVLVDKTFLPRYQRREADTQDMELSEKVVHWLGLLRDALFDFQGFDSRAAYVQAYRGELPLDALWLEYLLVTQAAKEEPLTSIRDINLKNLIPTMVQQYIDVIDAGLKSSDTARCTR